MDPAVAEARNPVWANCSCSSKLETQTPGEARGMNEVVEEGVMVRNGSFGSFLLHCTSYAWLPTENKNLRSVHEYRTGWHHFLVVPIEVERLLLPKQALVEVAGGEGSPEVVDGLLRLEKGAVSPPWES